MFTTCRYACSIEVPDSGELVVSGGGNWNAISRVQVYSTKGAKQRLPDMQQPRKIHACSYYYDDRNEMVDYIYCLFMFVYSDSVTVLIVRYLVVDSINKIFMRRFTS